MAENLMVIGRVRRAHGLRGEVLVEVLTDFPDRFESLKDIDLSPPSEQGSGRTIRVIGVRSHTQGIIMRLEGVDSREEAESLKHHWLNIPREDAVPLPPGEFYCSDLVGLEVIDVEGRSLGRLREVHRFPAHDVYEVWDEEGGRELLLPAVEEVVKDIDLAQGVMKVELIQGMAD